MKISNDGVSNHPVSPKPPVSRPGAARGSVVESGSSEGDAYVPSQELRRLQELLRQHSEVRADRVEQVMDRLRQGSYLTPESDSQTADAILAAAD